MNQKELLDSLSEILKHRISDDIKVSELKKIINSESRDYHTLQSIFDLLNSLPEHVNYNDILKLRNQFLTM